MSAAQALGSSRSTTSGIIAAPSLSRSALSAASSRSAITTRAPAASIASALASPMPDAAPVTTATLPSKSFANSLAMRLSLYDAAEQALDGLDSRHLDGSQRREI